jgi:hypothetical protein
MLCRLQIGLSKFELFIPLPRKFWNLKKCLHKFQLVEKASQAGEFLYSQVIVSNIH